MISTIPVLERVRVEIIGSSFSPEHQHETRHFQALNFEISENVERHLHCARSMRRKSIPTNGPRGKPHDDESVQSKVIFHRNWCGAKQIKMNRNELKAKITFDDVTIGFYFSPISLTAIKRFSTKSRPFFVFTTLPIAQLENTFFGRPLCVDSIVFASESKIMKNAYVGIKFTRHRAAWAASWNCDERPFSYRSDSVECAVHRKPHRKLNQNRFQSEQQRRSRAEGSLVCRRRIDRVVEFRWIFVENFR